MNNIKEVREELARQFERFKKGEISVKDMSEVNNMVGKMTKMATVEMEYHIQRKEQKVPQIPFLESGDVNATSE